MQDALNTLDINVEIEQLEPKIAPQSETGYLEHFLS
jgi:hypothetical protein